MTQSNSQNDSLGWPSDYPLFLSPMELESKDRSEWSRREARAYLNWVMSIRAERVDQLRSYTGRQAHSTVSLQSLAQDIAQLIRSSAAEATGKNSLWGRSGQDSCLMPDDAGISIGADFGLCCAELAEKMYPNALEWTIGGGGKTNIFYNMPVIHAVGEKRRYLHTSPIGAGVALAWGVADGQEWRTLLELYPNIILKLEKSNSANS